MAGSWRHLHLRRVGANLKQEGPVPDIVNVEGTQRWAARHNVVKVNLLLPHVIVDKHLYVPEEEREPGKQSLLA